MSEEEKINVQYFLQWVQEGGLAAWIQHFIDQGDEAKLRQIKEVFDKIKQIFGF